MKKSYPEKFVDAKGLAWHRADHLSILERRNSLFRFRGKIMYTRLRKAIKDKPSCQAYAAKTIDPRREIGIFSRLREMFTLQVLMLG